MSTLPWHVVTATDSRLYILDARDEIVAAVGPDGPATAVAIKDAALLVAAPLLHNARKRVRDLLTPEQDTIHPILKSAPALSRIHPEFQ